MFVNPSMGLAVCHTTICTGFTPNSEPGTKLLYDKRETNSALQQTFLQAKKSKKQRFDQSQGLLPSAAMGHRAAMLLGLLAVSIAVQHAAAAADCGALLKEYYEFNYHQQLAPAGAQELLYVLRTPNTYARELDTCLIRFGVPGTQRCPSQGERESFLYTISISISSN
jgi:hypothetical protein